MARLFRRKESVGNGKHAGLILALIYLPELRRKQLFDNDQYCNRFGQDGGLSSPADLIQNIILRVCMLNVLQHLYVCKSVFL